MSMPKGLKGSIARSCKLNDLFTASISCYNFPQSAVQAVSTIVDFVQLQKPCDVPIYYTLVQRGDFLKNNFFTSEETQSVFSQACFSSLQVLFAFIAVNLRLLLLFLICSNTSSLREATLLAGHLSKTALLSTNVKSHTLLKSPNILSSSLKINFNAASVPPAAFKPYSIECLLKLLKI